MTKQGVDHAIEFLKDEDVTIHLHNVSEESWGTILASVWKSTGIIVAMPTYEYKMYPPMASLLEEISKKKVQNRKAFRIGSYGWSGGAQKELNEIMTKYNTGWEFIEPVEYMGCPTNEDLKAIKKGVKQGVEQGIEQGIEQGEKKKAIEIAKNLIDVLDIKTISMKTGLMEEEVLALAAAHRSAG